MTMQETEKSILDDLAELGDILSRSELLIRLGKRFEGIPQAERSEADLIKNCQTTTWVECRWEKDTLKMRSDSQSLLVKGALALIDEIYNGRSKSEVAGFNCTLLKEESFYSLFSERQRLGMESIIEKLSTVN